MKTQPLRHQSEALRRMNGREHYALFMDMGTGKTWTLLADAERLYCAGKAEGLLVIAPKGVHTNWVLREVPAHLEVPHIAVAFRSSAGKHETKRTMRVFAPRAVGEVAPLRVFAINIDALIHKRGFDFAMKFVLAVRGCIVVVDESDLIKNPHSARTKAVMRLGHMAAFRRIATGTPVTQAPLDLFAQMEFLESGLLGTTSYRAFVAEHADLLPPEHPLVQHVIERQMAKNPRAAAAQLARGGTPRIIARDPTTNQPRYRNLEALAARIAPHSFRVRKEECLDLPPKVYKTRFFELGAAQRALYDEAERDARIVFAEGDVGVFRGASIMAKLQQITSGFVIVDGDPRDLDIDANPRMDELLAVLRLASPPFIVWAHFVEEHRRIAQVLQRAGLSVAQYTGATSDAARNTAIDEFQAGRIDVFLGQEQSGGVGITLTAARTVVYFSNGTSTRYRLQSEDRSHRRGTRHSVLYVDLAAVDTVDESIAAAHQHKLGVARQLLDDRGLALPPGATEDHA